MKIQAGLLVLCADFPQDVSNDLHSCCHPLLALPLTTPRSHLYELFARAGMVAPLLPAQRGLLLSELVLAGGSKAHFVFPGKAKCSEKLCMFHSGDFPLLFSFFFCIRKNKNNP